MHPPSIHGRATPLSEGGGACRPPCALYSWDSGGGFHYNPRSTKVFREFSNDWKIFRSFSNDWKKIFQSLENFFPSGFALLAPPGL
jgi:hypothetical protein